MKIALRFTLACLLLGGCDAAVPPPAPQGVQSPGTKMLPIQRVEVVAGHSLALLTVNAIDKHCLAIAGLLVRATSPAHGTVQIEHISAFPQYGKGHPLVACNAVRTQMTRVIYHPAAGYTGDDKVAVEVSSTDNPTTPHTIRFEISVDGSF